MSHTASASSKNRLPWRSAGTFLAAVAVLASGLLVFRLYHPAAGFRYFEPAYLPPHVSIVAKRLDVYSHDTQAMQSFRATDWIYAIQEYKATDDIGSATQSYNPASIKPTCSLLVSPGGARYRLCHWIDYGRIDVHEVTFIRSGTFIQSTIPTNLHQPISISEVGTFVDSFRPSTTTWLPVLRSSV